ncbi:hypothetical protein Jden_0757 [Jonesia denitrificans DSM 20603]|uniref:Prevent-host-death family protein n=2 Tax=Jonesia TaxID=43673 RepID=C7R1V2_JONDD|nr:hypothetical protein Jden_0757 [Jonesia denitrificans DSM 20603]SQH20399.1 Protein of uncharacterised function (DUF3832) [Jonesia denitrificans]
MYTHVQECSLVDMASVFKTNEARSAMSDVLNQARQARTPIIERGAEHYAVTEKASLLSFLNHTVEARPQVILEDGAYVLIIPGLPFASEATTIDEAVDNLMLDLREYAQDWKDVYSAAPNHVENWGLVTLISLLSDNELKEWLIDA